MTVTILLSLLCLACTGAAFQLSPAAGRLPATVAALTLIPLLLQFRLDRQSPRAPRAAPAAMGVLTLLILLALLFLTGFFVALPLYIGWCYRRRPGAALGAMCLTLALLALLHQQVELYGGVLWPR